MCLKGREWSGQRKIRAFRAQQRNSLCKICKLQDAGENDFTIILLDLITHTDLSSWNHYNWARTKCQHEWKKDLLAFMNTSLSLSFWWAFLCLWILICASGLQSRSPYWNSWSHSHMGPCATKRSLVRATSRHWGRLYLLWRLIFRVMKLHQSNREMLSLALYTHERKSWRKKSAYPVRMMSDLCSHGGTLHMYTAEVATFVAQLMCMTNFHPISNSDLDWHKIFSSMTRMPVT